MRMWLAEEIPPLPHEDPGSPPLEGGEALCEFMVDHTTEQEYHYLHVLRSLPNLLEENKVACIKDVLPKLKAALPNSHGVQPEDEDSILTILERELVPTATFTQIFLQSITSSIDSKDPDITNAWLETLMDIIDVLPLETIKTDILTLAITKGQHSQALSSRLASCKILGKICTKFESFFIKKEILPLVQSLCQDVDYEVRSCIAYQLDAVSRGLGLEVAKTAILPWLVELANDDTSFVRIAIIETVVNMLSMLDDETCILTIIPLVKKFCEFSLKMEDAALPIASKQLGRLCHGLSVNLKLEEKQWFLNYFRQLAHLGLPQSGEHERSSATKMPDLVPLLDGYDKYMECRQNCAYNFPAMVLFAQPVNFETELFETFCDLISDPHSKVRYTMASGLHEVAKLLGSNVHILQHQLVVLLQEDCLEVIDGLVANLPITLEALAREGSMNSENKLEDADDIIDGLLMCEDAIANSSNWRLHADFLSKLSCLPRCLTSDSIYSTFVPRFFHKLYTLRPIPCRIAAATTLLVFLRCNPYADQRIEICTRIIQELCHGHSCHRRMLFIRMCDIAMGLFSKGFFKAHFFTHLLMLSEDRVPNIRLRFCTILPSLKALIILPTDQNLLQALEACIKKLMANEKDKDVSASLRNAIMELDKIEMIDLTNRHSGVFEDAIDLAKEEEEKVIIQLEKKLHLRKMQEKQKREEQSLNVSRSSKIPYLERSDSTPIFSQQKSSNLLKSPSRIGSQSLTTESHSGMIHRSKFKTELKSAIPVPKRMSFPNVNVNASIHKTSPDSPRPSPETIRKASLSQSSLSAGRPASSNSVRHPSPAPPYRTRYISASSPSLSFASKQSPSLPSSPRSERSFSSTYQSTSIIALNMPKSRILPIPRCNTPPMFADMVDSDDVELDLCDQLMASHLFSDDEDDDPPSDPWSLVDDSENLKPLQCTSPTLHDGENTEGFSSDNEDSLSYSMREAKRIPTPIPVHSPGKNGTTCNNDSSGTNHSSIPRPNLRYQHSLSSYSPSKVIKDEKLDGLTDRGRAISQFGRAQSKSDRLESSNYLLEKTANKTKPSLMKAKSASQLNPGFARKVGQSFIPRASRCSVEKSPSAPGTPRSMSPVRLQLLNSNRQLQSPRLSLHLPLSQSLHSHLAGRKFFSRPGSPASISGDSDGQATPDSPGSYGSNDSLSSNPESSRHARLRRFSGGTNRSPSLIPRSVSNYSRR